MPSNNATKAAAVPVCRDASVLWQTRPLRPWLEDPAVTEIAVNRPGEVFCERASRWERHEVPEMTYKQCEALSTAVAQRSSQDFSDVRPILSAVLAGGERIQCVQPAACEADTISITVRKPSAVARTLEDYDRQGFFGHVRPLTSGPLAAEVELLRLKEEGRYLDFLRRAVQLEKVIVVAGETGSGKTTLMKALVQEISPEQRIVTIEDVAELSLQNHPNHIHLFYPSEAKEEENAPLTAGVLLRSCLRMKPNRILLAELRGGETFEFLNIAASGHGGSITSCHAGSAELAFERLALMTLQNRQGRTLPYSVIRKLLFLVVDVVVHVHHDTTGTAGRHITEIWYDPAKKREAARATE